VLSVGAQASAQDAATAGALFDKGVAEMQAGHFDTACPAIEESQRLDPHPGTLFTLAECQSKWGKVASAVAHYQDYVGLVSRLARDQQARHRDRVNVANAQLAKLKPSLPQLTLSLPATAPEGTSVTRDGVPLQGIALGTALPVDPGEHVIITQAPGAEPHRMTVTIALSETKNVVLDVVAASAPSAQVVAPSNELPHSEIQPEPSPNPSRPSRTPAFVVGGIGVAGIAVGAVTGVLVLGKKSVVSDECDGKQCRSQKGVDAAKSGQTLGLISDIGFGVGIAGLAVGAVLLLTGHSHSEQSAHRTLWQPLVATTPGGAWAGLSRRW